MKVRLITYSQPSDEIKESGLEDVQDLIAYCARVSNPSNQLNTETSEKLIKYLIKNAHWSPLEMVSATLEITTTRDIARQILRHRSFSFQEFCIAGDTMITLELPSGVKSGKRHSYKRSIEHLFKLQQNGQLPSGVRVFDEDTRTFVVRPIKEVFQTGIKPVYKITLDNGRTITSTKEHKFLTKHGFESLEDAVGLSLINNRAVMSKSSFFGCNGIPVYTDPVWLANAKNASIEAGIGLRHIADAANTTTHTIRKWLKKHNLQFTKKEVASSPELAYDKNNIQELCSTCHDEIHGLSGETMSWREKSRGNALTLHWSRVVKVEYVGEIMTYDMEVDHHSHNYVGNGIITHNSQRYADPTKDLDFVVREARLQDPKNRQNSIPVINDVLQARWEVEQQRVIDAAKEAYKWAISHGIAKEQARAVLPEGNTVSRIYMAGTLRSWIHYIELRSGNGTQLEHQQIAIECARVIASIFPMANGLY